MLEYYIGFYNEYINNLLLKIYTLSLFVNDAYFFKCQTAQYIGNIGTFMQPARCKSYIIIITKI